ncbi:tetratricopeptide repeat protein [Algibacter pacificus]|uniref:tetratricopeptide repeat protein n=1 Tax=Algibacter pacificus TaxID=2599389 RepID=UPI0011CC5A21|nr:tetratricopeptide repeat protein [Algibacter pacificus]
MKKHTTLIFIVLPVLLFGQANKYFRQALKTEDLTERIALLNQVIDLDSDKLDAYFYRGIAKNDIGDFSGAIVDYSKIILSEPDADTFFNRGNARYSIEDFEGAKADYKEAIKLDPLFIDAIYSLGCANFDLGNYTEAITVFTQLLEIDAYYPKAYTLRGMSYEQLEEYKLAAKDYSLAVFTNPSANTYYNRGVFLLGINYYKKAKNDFDRTIRLNDKNSFAYFYRGVTHLLLGKYKNAIPDFETALEFDALDFDAMLGISMTYYRLNNFAQAKIYFEKASHILKTNENTATGVQAYENTFWYKNQLYFFTEMLKKLEQL